MQQTTQDHLPNRGRKLPIASAASLSHCGNVCNRNPRSHCHTITAAFVVPHQMHAAPHLSSHTRVILPIRLVA
jgi:hypothetical protein